LLIMSARPPYAAIGRPPPMILPSVVKSGFTLDKERLDVQELRTERGNLQLIIHYVPMTVMEKMYEKLNNVAEEMKNKLISQIVTYVSGKIF